MDTLSANTTSVFTDQTSLTNKGKITLLLLFLPVVYSILNFLWYYQSKAFFTTFPDSTYIYLINGTNIASGNFTIGHFDNPGTTAHWLAGIVIFITHLFFGKGPLMEDVLSNPEFYLCACTIACIALLFVSVFAAGRLILKNTGNITVALFFQLIPVCSYLNVHHIVRFCPEYVIIATLPFYCAYLWVLVYKKNNTPGFVISIKSILFLAFITAALFIAKITCVPFIFVPLFFIDKISRKIFYLIATAAFGMLILFPVWPNLSGMFNWFLGLANHTGIYGSGKEQFIDKSAFITSLKELLTTEWFFTIGFILATILMLAGLLKKKWKNNFYKLNVAFWITIVLQLLLAAKHYKFHYIIPAQSLIIPTVLAGLIPFAAGKINTLYGKLIFAGCAVFLVYKLGYSATDYWGGNNQYKSSVAAQKYADVPKIITTSYDESCFVESALHFGAAYGGWFFEPGREFLRKKYPHSFVYEPENNKIELFFLDVPNSEIFEKYPQVLLYFRGRDANTERDMINKITAEYAYGIKSVDLLSTNFETGDKFYMINIDTFVTKPHYTNKKTIGCDFETTTADKMYTVSNDGFSYFGNANLRSNEQHSSGAFSLMANSKNQYVGWSNFKVNPGDAFEISVNCYSEDMSGGITLSSPSRKGFQASSQNVIHDFGNGWKTVSLKAKVPRDYSEKEVGFSLFYFGSKNCYFDDLNVTHLQK